MARAGLRRGHEESGERPSISRKGFCRKACIKRGRGWCQESVQPTFRSVIVESFLCVSDLSKGNYIRSTTPEGKRKSELGSLVSFLVKKLPCAKPTPICGVHLQQANRRSANRTATRQ